MNKMYSINPISRILLGSGLLFLAATTTSIYYYIVLLPASILILRCLDGHWLTSIRLLRLMRWFVFPVLLLHALLSPGQLLWPDFFIPVSREGLLEGVRLSLHLGAVFFVAMVMFRMLRRAEWLHAMLLLPGLGQRLAVYVWMMHSMKINIAILLADLRMQFRLRRDLKASALLLMSAFQQTLENASDHAAALWLRWPEHMPVLELLEHQHTHSMHYYLMSILVALLGCAAFLEAWL